SAAPLIARFDQTGFDRQYSGGAVATVCLRGRAHSGRSRPGSVERGRSRFDCRPELRTHSRYCSYPFFTLAQKRPNSRTVLVKEKLEVGPEDSDREGQYRTV